MVVPIPIGIPDCRIRQSREIGKVRDVLRVDSIQTLFALDALMSIPHPNRLIFWMVTFERPLRSKAN